MTSTTDSPVTTPAEARARYGYHPAFLAALTTIAEHTGKTFAEVVTVARAHRERIGDMSFILSEVILWNREALGLATEAEANALVAVAYAAYDAVPIRV